MQLSPTAERAQVKTRTDRVGVLTDQLLQSRALSQPRLEGMTDAEYLWEPVEGTWSIRRKGHAVTDRAYGRGEWVLDFERRDPLAPGPVTTIAWRLGHLISMFAGRWEWTFGGRKIPPEDLVEFKPQAQPALEELWAWVPRWVDGIQALSEEDLETPGFGQYPWGLDPQIPFIGIVWWMNREFIHHFAEVALLRDLYVPLSSGGPATRT